jgi:hypothetical protein
MSKPPRRADEGLISGWLFFRYMAIGGYVGECEFDNMCSFTNKSSSISSEIKIKRVRHFNFKNFINYYIVSKFVVSNLFSFA